MKEIIIVLVAIDICISINNSIKLQKIMAQNAQLAAMITRLDTATNEIAADLQKLRDDLAAGGVDGAQLTALDAQITRLETLGQDPANPIPNPGEEPVPEEPTT